MNLTEFTYLLNKPDAVNDRQTEALEKIVSEFPYFQSARAMRLKGLYNQNSFQYNYALKVAAAYTTDRSVLFDFITSDTFTAIQKGQYEQKLNELHNIDVKGSEVIKVDHTEADANKLQQSILTSIRESEQAYQHETEAAIPAEAITMEAEVIPQPVEVAEEKVSEAEPVREINYAEFVPPEITTTEFVPAEDTNPEKQGIAEQEISAKDETPVIALVAPEPEAAVPTQEEKLQIGMPLEFSRDEKHSFGEWLKLSTFKPIVREEEKVEAQIQETADETIPDPEKLKKLEIIDRFIEANPKIPPITIKADAVAPVIAEPYKEDSVALMTETLARVYLEQRKYQKAIQAYEILILKYPEKSSFFADRISDIKKLQQNNTL
ncbi:MAG TPA: hypothetical protein VGB50_04260 [Flavobacterium sp.]